MTTLVPPLGMTNDNQYAQRRLTPQVRGMLSSCSDTGTRLETVLSFESGDTSAWSNAVP
jgi:hypothetical protein